MKKENSPIEVGLIGRGTVGKGVEEWFDSKNAKKFNIKLNKIAVAHPEKHQDAIAPVTKDPYELIEDKGIKVVVELMGGIDPAYEYVSSALDNGKSVVTANKAVVATHMPDLYEKAEKNGVDLAYEASVGGGIRIVNSINTYEGEEIREIVGILNGTSNFILTEMGKGKTFNQALKMAREKGFAEADHSSDTGGHDAKYKLSILASLGFNTWFDPEKISTKGITDISNIDIDFAANHGRENGGRGHTIKQLAVARRLDDRIVDLYVSPALIRNDHPLASVRGEYNGILLNTQLGGLHQYSGKGAGQKPTASAVVADLIRVTDNWMTNLTDPYPSLDSGMQIADPGERMNAGYIRMDLLNQPGSLHEVSGIMSKQALNIANTSQRDRFEHQLGGDNFIPDIHTIYEAKSNSIDHALDNLRKSKKIHGKPVFIRIETPLSDV